MDGSLVRLLEWLRYLMPQNTYGALSVIDIVHHRIHQCCVFKVDSVSAATSLDLAFKVPDGDKRTHFFFQWAAESMAHIQIYEGRTWTPGTGSKTPIYNRDRNSPNESYLLEDTTGEFIASMGVVKDPTGQSGGVVLHDEWTWSDRKETARSRDISEFILKNDTTYVLKLTSDDGVKGLHGVMHWYEQIPEEES